MAQGEKPRRKLLERGIRFGRDLWVDGYKLVGGLAPLLSLLVTLLKYFEVPVVKDVSYTWALAPLLLWVLVAYIHRRSAHEALKEQVAPKIALRFEPTDEFRKRVTLSSDGRNWSGISIRGIAETDCDHPLANCSAYATRVEFRDKNSSFKTIPPYERMKLKWALERDEFAPVSIAKDAPAHFGIVQAHERIRHFEVPTQVRSHSHPPEFCEPGTYRVTVVVTSPNCASATMALLICWNGEWFSIEAQLDSAPQMSHS